MNTSTAYAIIDERVKLLEAERDVVAKDIDAGLRRDIAELHARADAAIKPYNTAIGELKRLRAELRLVEQTEDDSTAESDAIAIEAR